MSTGDSDDRVVAGLAKEEVSIVVTALDFEGMVKGSISSVAGKETKGKRKGTVECVFGAV